MFFVLIENLFLGYVSMSLHRKLDNRFISSCVIVTCFCGTMLVSLNFTGSACDYILLSG